VIKAFITDFGGVLMRTRTDGMRRDLERRLGLPPNTIEQRVFASDLSRRAQGGELDENAFWQALELELDLPRLGLTWQSFYHDFFAEDFVDEELITLIRGLRPALKTGLISNAWSGLRAMLNTRVPIADAFDTLVISAEEKILKPDARIYRAALNRLGVQPLEAIFLDDFIENVHAANALGLHGIHFTSSAQAQRDIQALLSSQ
jgi:putative hydrolase of the HAD superfamily